MTTVEILLSGYLQQKTWRWRDWADNRGWSGINLWPRRNVDVLTNNALRLMTTVARNKAYYCPLTDALVAKILSLL